MGRVAADHPGCTVTRVGAARAWSAARGERAPREKFLCCTTPQPQGWCSQMGPELVRQKRLTAELVVGFCFFLTRFFDHPAILDALADNRGVLLCGHWWSSHQFFE